MTRRDWWIGITAVVLAILLHAAIPRYTWQHATGMLWTRADRWTGQVSLAGYADGKWSMVDTRRLSVK